MKKPPKPQPIQFLLLTLGIFTGIFLSVQLASPAAESVDPYEPLKDLQESLNILSTDQTRLQERIGAARKEIQELENVVAGGEQKKTLEQLKTAIGLAETSGPGVIATLDDAEQQSTLFGKQPDAVCYAADLRDIVNILRVAGAAAIGINGQRIIDTTSVICVGQNVLVNNVRMLPPFTIVAVSSENSEQLVTYLETDKFLPDLHERARSSAIRFEIAAVDDVTVPLFKGNLDLAFTKAL